MPFHDAFLVRDLDEARRFYAGVLGCSGGARRRGWTSIGSATSCRVTWARRRRPRTSAGSTGSRCRCYPGEVGEQATCLFLDPSGNAIEIKAFARDDELFRS
jgi:uncharacterized protein